MAGIASKSQLRMSFLRYALFTVPGVLLLGTLAGALGGAGEDNAWFAALRKPAMMPPGWAFGAAWTLLYIMLGLSLAMLLHARDALVVVDERRRLLAPVQEERRASVHLREP